MKLVKMKVLIHGLNGVGVEAAYTRTAPQRAAVRDPAPVARVAPRVMCERNAEHRGVEEVELEASCLRGVPPRNVVPVERARLTRRPALVRQRRLAAVPLPPPRRVERLPVVARPYPVDSLQPDPRLAIRRDEVPKEGVLRRASYAGEVSTCDGRRMGGERARRVCASFGGSSLGRRSRRGRTNEQRPMDGADNLGQTKARAERDRHVARRTLNRALDLSLRRVKQRALVVVARALE